MSRSRSASVGRKPPYPRRPPPPPADFPPPPDDDHDDDDDNRPRRGEGKRNGGSDSPSTESLARRYAARRKRGTRRAHDDDNDTKPSSPATLAAESAARSAASMMREGDREEEQSRHRDRDRDRDRSRRDRDDDEDRSRRRDRDRDDDEDRSRRRDRDRDEDDDKDRHRPSRSYRDSERSRRERDEPSRIRSPASTTSTVGSPSQAMSRKLKLYSTQMGKLKTALKDQLQVTIDAQEAQHTAEDELEALEKKYRALEDKHAVVQAKLHSASREASIMRNNRDGSDELEEEVRRLQAQLEDKETIEADAIKVFEAKKRLEERFLEHVSETDLVREKLQDRANRESDRADALERTLAERDEQLETMEIKLVEAHKNVEDGHALAARLSDTASSMTETKRELADQVIAAEKEIKQLQEQLKERERAAEGRSLLSAELRSARSELDAVRGSEEQLKEALREQLDASTQIIQDKKEAEAARDELVEEVRGLRDRNEELNAQLEQVREETEHVMEKLTAEVAEHREEAEQQETLLASLKVAVAAATEEAETLRREVGVARKMADERAVKIAELEWDNVNLREGGSGGIVRSSVVSITDRKSGATRTGRSVAARRLAQEALSKSSSPPSRRREEEDDVRSRTSQRRRSRGGIDDDVRSRTSQRRGSRGGIDDDVRSRTSQRRGSRGGDDEVRSRTSQRRGSRGGDDEVRRPRRDREQDRRDVEETRSRTPSSSSAMAALAAARDRHDARERSESQVSSASKATEKTRRRESAAAASALVARLVANKEKEMQQNGSVASSRSPPPASRRGRSSRRSSRALSTAELEDAFETRQDRRMSTARVPSDDEESAAIPEPLDLPVFAEPRDPKDVLTAGWMFKRPWLSIISSWRRRFFLLTRDATLEFFSEDDRTKRLIHRGTVRIEPPVELRIALEQERPDEFDFELECGRSKQNTKLRCELSEDRDKWVLALRDVGLAVTECRNLESYRGRGGVLALFGGSVLCGLVRDRSAGLRRGERVKRDFKVPYVMWRCMELIKERALDKQGVFRVPGTQARVAAMRSALEDGKDISEFLSQVNDVASVLRIYLRELAEPLVPTASYESFVAPFATKHSSSERTAALRAAVNDLPQDNREAILYLLHGLTLIVRRQERNKMTSHNCAVVFAPNLFRKPAEEAPNEAGGGWLSLTLTGGGGTRVRSSSNAFRSSMANVQSEILCLTHWLDHFRQVSPDYTELRRNDRRR